MRQKPEQITTRVLIGGTLPILLSDIIATIVQCNADIYLLRSDTEEIGSLVEFISTHDIDVVIVGCDFAVMEKACLELLRIKYGLMVLAISTSGDSGTLFTLEPRAQSLGDLSPQTLLDVIRSHHSHSVEITPRQH